MGAITATAGTLGVTATAGSINDAADDNTADFTAGGLITLTAQDEIGVLGSGSDTDLEFAASSSVNVSTTGTGAIDLDGLGALTLSDVDTDGTLCWSDYCEFSSGSVDRNFDGASGTNGRCSIVLSTTSGDIDRFSATEVENVNFGQPDDAVVRLSLLQSRMINDMMERLPGYCNLIRRVCTIDSTT